MVCILLPTHIDTCFPELRYFWKSLKDEGGNVNVFVEWLSVNTPHSAEFYSLPSSLSLSLCVSLSLQS